jgi:uroporphyrinogen-III synthase
VIRGDLAGDALATSLRRRSARVDDVVAYRTLEAPTSSLPILRGAVDGGPIAAVVFTSGSTVRGLVSLAGRLSIDLRQVPAVCIGRATAEAATAAGFRVAAVAETPDPVALAAAAAAAVARQPVEVS